MVPDQVEAMYPNVVTLFRNNHNLKEISANIDVFVELPFEFKLQKLHMNRRFIEKMFDGECLQNFLKSQAHTLESLEIEVYITQACLELIVSSMPRLETLKLDLSSVEKPISNEAFKVNNTITSIEVFHYVYFAPERAPFHNFIRALSNLKHFKCCEVNDAGFLFLTQDVPALESLETENFSVSRLPEGDILPNLKVLKVKKFHYELPAPTGYNNFAALLTSEMSKYYQRLHKKLSTH